MAGAGRGPRALSPTSPSPWPCCPTGRGGGGGPTCAGARADPDRGRRRRLGRGRGQRWGCRSPPTPAARRSRAGWPALASYELGLRYEPEVGAERDPDWPDLVVGLYPALLAFDHQARRVLALGRAQGPRRQARAARPGRAGRISRFRRGRGVWPTASSRSASRTAIARLWRMWWPGSRRARSSRPTSPAAGAGVSRRGRGRSTCSRVWPRRAPRPLAAFARWPGLALVSNSPERFLRAHPTSRVETRPIR